MSPTKNNGLNKIFKLFNISVKLNCWYLKKIIIILIKGIFEHDDFNDDDDNGNAKDQNTLSGLLTRIIKSNRSNKLKLPKEEENFLLIVHIVENYKNKIKTNLTELCKT